jgi:hypothetical protein
MTKTRLILLIVFAVLLSMLLAKAGIHGMGMNDGPWID